MIQVQRHHEQAVLDLICAAFREDPQFLAYTDGHPAKMRLIARLIFETCLASNTIFLTEDLNAVALCKTATLSRLQLKVLWIQFMFPFILGPKLFLRLLRIEHALEKKRLLQGNQLYIWLLATHPEHQGKGLANGLLEHINKLMPLSYKTILLETSKPSNLDYYQKRGYQMYDNLAFDHNLTIYFMRREYQQEQ